MRWAAVSSSSCRRREVGLSDHWLRSRCRRSGRSFIGDYRSRVRTSKTKYKMPKSQRPDDTVAGSTKRLASRFYQLKMGHCRTGQYLHWAKVRPPQFWWCQSPTQTREHLFKVCREWRMPQNIPWAEVRKETGRGKSRWTIQDLFADQR